MKHKKEPVTVNVINKRRDNQLPLYQTSGSSGLDLAAELDHPLEIKPLERLLIPTGIWLSIPIGYEGQIRPRSGLALKHGITCLNTPGTIDADYRGEIKVLLINLSNESFVIEPNQRIAQIVFCPVAKAELIQVGELDFTDRSNGGFGHTGTR
ncbi:MAG: dUTP diphosphatase [Bacillota bacterium]|nr:dUTP diphosphatase [Bacillota bacterium]